eukprot:m.545298 g.545298  ORF g.545298 m.545298 type:complete len:656 (+) comp22144_c1_seq2:326-2293(+)
MFEYGAYILTCASLLFRTGTLALETKRASQNETQHCYVPIPYKYYKSSLNGHQYFHSWQCVYAGLIYYTNIATECNSLLSMQNQSRFQTKPNMTARSCCVNSESPLQLNLVTFHERSNSESPFRQGLRSVFYVSDTLFLGDPNVSQFMDLAHPLPKTMNSAACNVDVTDTDASAFLHRHLVSQGVAKYPRMYAGIRPACRIEEIYPMSSLLMVNRRRNRRFVNAHGLSTVLGAAYVDEMGDFSFREQLDLFSRYSIILMSHGAGETNFLASSSWQAQHTIPVSAIIVCPPYLHCGCITTGIAIDGGGTCARHYKPISRQDVLMSTIVYEFPGKNCSTFCSEVRNSKVSVKKWRSRLRDIRNYPPLPLETISLILRDRVYPRVREHCRGNTSAHGVEHQFKDQAFTVYMNDTNRCSYSMMRGNSTEAILHDMLKAHAYTHAIGRTFCGAAGYLSDDQNESLSSSIRMLGLEQDLPVHTVPNALLAPNHVRLHQVLSDDYDRYDLMDEKWILNLKGHSSGHSKEIGNSTGTTHRILLLLGEEIMHRVDTKNGTSNTGLYGSETLYAEYFDIIRQYREEHSQIVVFGTGGQAILEGFRSVGCSVKQEWTLHELWADIMQSSVVVVPVQEPRCETYIPVMLSRARIVYSNSSCGKALGL